MNYLSVAIRNILKYKIFSSLNVFGLTMAMSVCMLVQAQSPSEKANELSQTIAFLDSAFFHAYNTSDEERMASFFSEDIEFYHDKGGLTSSRSKLKELFKGFGNKTYELRRELVTGSFKVYPLNSYSAIQFTDNRFYTKEKDKNERIELAKQIIIWRVEGGEWKLFRVMSFDHEDVQKTIEPSVTLELNNELTSLDSVLYGAINNCNHVETENLLTEDLEFYHYSGVITKSNKSYIESNQKACGKNNKSAVRRELLNGSLKVFLLKKYGAIQTGTHRFYELKGKKEKLAYEVKFVHIWQNKDGVWRISRAINYDYQAL